MATRQSLDYLVREFAKMRGVSADNAVRIAVMEAIKREREASGDADDDALNSTAIAPRIKTLLAFASAIAGVYLLISCLVPHQLFQAVYYEDSIWKVLIGVGLLSAEIAYFWTNSRFYKA